LGARDARRGHRGRRADVRERRARAERHAGVPAALLRRAPALHRPGLPVRRPGGGRPGRAAGLHGGALHADPAGRRVVSRPGRGQRRCGDPGARREDHRVVPAARSRGAAGRGAAAGARGPARL
ncbi:MAG: hypothetical protein AVDCRST_MAG13-1722, partial [uncultured Solirubrobacteraceae bacterium]